MKILFLLKKSCVFLHRSILIILMLLLHQIFLPGPSCALSNTTDGVEKLSLPAPGVMVTLSDKHQPMVIKGINFSNGNPLQLDFIIDPGGNPAGQDDLRVESIQLIKYFLTSLTIPEDELWVNLSPLEENRIIPDNFAKTEMGRDLLAQDYLLKQLTASLMYPEDELGKNFWNKVYEKAQRIYGTTQIPMDTFNKVWIIPQQAVVYEHQKGVYIVSSYLKVMMEEDYLMLENNSIDQHGVSARESDRQNKIRDVSAQIVRDLIIPEIEREVNEGKNFAKLRQIYHSMILAAWYKQSLKESLLGKIYVDQSRTKGVEVNVKDVHQQIYDRYLEAFKVGVYDYIKEDVDPLSNEPIPRRYYSGGVVLKGDRQRIDESMFAERMKDQDGKQFFLVRANLEEYLNQPPGTDQAVLAKESVENQILKRLLPYSQQNLAHRSFDTSGRGHINAKLTPAILQIVMDTMERHHKGQVRADGITSYLTHPLNVAAIYVHEMGLTDAETIVATFLHDVVENTLTHQTDKDLDELDEEQARIIRQTKPKKPRIKKRLIRTANQVKKELREQGVEAKGLNLDKVFEIVLALSKYDGQKLVDNYFVEIIKAGPDAIAAKFADQIHNLRSNRFAKNSAFVQKYIFGERNREKGSIYLYLEAPIANTGRSFADHLPWNYRHIKILYQINVLHTILENLDRLDNMKTKRETVETIKRIAPDLSITGGFASRQDILNYAMGQLHLQLMDALSRKDESMLAVDGQNNMTKGGIDLNVDYLNLKILRDGQGIPLPVFDQPTEAIQVEGLVPVIIQIEPIQNLPFIFGLKEENKPELRISRHN